MIKISVIIPSYNDLNSLKTCLGSLSAQKTQHSFEIIVVDSSDETGHIPSEESFPSIKLITLKGRTYPGTARNIGLQHARGDLIAFVDSDCRVFPDWIEQIMSENDNNVEEIIGGAIINGTPRNLIGTADYLLGFSDFLPSQTCSYRKTLPTCNLSLWKKTLEKTGSFKDLIKGSDTLFTFHALRKGVKLRFVPSIRVVHQNRIRLKKFLRNQRDLGYGSFAIRKLSPLSGRFLTESPWFVPLIVPIRLFTTLRKSLRAGFKNIFPYIVTLPLLVCGLIAYSVGFYKNMSQSHEV
jgi:glycosyltransferase involved in cell wall biosynthesis